MNVRACKKAGQLRGLRRDIKFVLVTWSQSYVS
jgi:hypothetical protein